MIGHPRVHFRVTDSTNERARALAGAGAPHGTLVTADEQQAGRGRQGRAWTAPARSAVLMSVVLRELDETLPLAAAVAVCEAVPVETQIKWPNDVWIDGRKAAGILVEGRPQEGWAVLGIGLNVTTEEFPPELDATSLALAGADVGVDEVLAALLDALRAWLARPPDDVLAAWRARDALLGRPVRWSNGSEEGTAAGIDASGALIVDTGHGRVRLDAGEVHLDR
jgi:BirA family biotin operon repressor/biotin-[acetyl-CoA-carboxylase] ligase